MGFGLVFLGILGIFLWIFIIAWFIKTRKKNGKPSVQEMADDMAVEKALHKEEGLD
ncbi:hypothetical protein KDA00_02525 [Candidatus Saccharibacteria bacterium]|nr:hypothetical protein [Candidatus Saccharibacteria bacterium]